MSDILFEIRGCVGLVTLNRVKPLNALTLDMIRQLSAKLEEWETDDQVEAVILTSASDRAFSAGADIRFVYENRENPPLEFFRKEYRMNCTIFNYPKPYLSLVDGIVMGGGVGLSFHGRYIAAGSKTTFAMPETGIGFFPDVGGSYILPRMPRKLGIYCGMTGARLGQADCKNFGLITHTINPDCFEQIVNEISGGQSVEEVLSKYNREISGQGLDGEMLDVIDECFSATSVVEVIANLKRNPHPFADQTLELLLSRSPTSVHIAFEQMKRGAAMAFDDCMQMEYRILERILLESDFYEGVRSTLVDKDNAPNWQPASFEAVSEEKVLSHFMPLASERELFERP